MTKVIASVVVAVTAALGGAALRYAHGAGTNPAPAAPRSPAPNVPTPLIAEAPRPASPARSVAGRPLPDEYRVIADRNIFASRQARAAAGAPATQPSGTAAFVLKGIAQRGGEFVAFVERGDTKQIEQVRVSNTVGRGKVRGMTLQCMDYETDGRVTRVEVGHALGGTSPGATPEPVAAVAAPRPATTRPARAAAAGPERGELASGARAKKP